MAESLRGKNIAVTGAASGMGLAIAKRLAAIGANVSLADVQEPALATAVSECESAARAAGHASTKFFSRATDVRDTASVNAWIAETVAAFGGGPLHGAANFAGVVGRELNSTRLDDIDDADWDFVVAVNMTGVMKCMRAQVRAMGEGVGGSIVNASSIMGVVGSGYREAYCASKHGVVGLSRSAARELAGRGIRVNVVCPGHIATPMMTSVGNLSVIEATAEVQATSMKRLAQAEEVVPTVIHLLSNDSSFTTGAVHMVDGGWFV